MASSCPADIGLIEIKEEMRLVLSTVKDIKSIDSKLDKMRNEFMATLIGKIQNLRDDIVMTISRESGRCDQLEKALQSLQSRFDTTEHTPTDSAVAADNGGVTLQVTQRQLDDPDLCIIVSGFAD